MSKIIFDYEYIDSIFDNSEVKIGDFTQTKLTEVC